MASAFDISEVDVCDDDESLDSVSVLRQAGSQAVVVAQKTNNSTNNSSNKNALYLYHEDNNLELFQRPTTPQVAAARATNAPSSGSAQQRSNLSSTNVNLASSCANIHANNNDTSLDGKQVKSGANLGTLSGVYFPCVQNIFGVILFIRMVWIVGTAGMPCAFSIVFICCCVTLTTSISLSAIATNGIVPAGGSYFMISRSLGPECGGAVGTLFFIGTTVAGAMYITGAVEITLNYIAPSWGLFGDFQRDVSILYHNIRVYGTLLLLIVGLMVWIGVKFVSKLAPVALFCVLLSIVSIFAGIAINYDGRQDLHICMLGDRLVALKNLPFDDAHAHQTPLHLSHADSQQNSSVNSRAFELRRNKALCSYDKLRFVFCPNEQLFGSTNTSAADNNNNNNNNNDASSQYEEEASLRQRQGNSASSYDSNNLQLSSNQQQTTTTTTTTTTVRQMNLAELGKRIFSLPANMSNCDEYFLANKHRIRLERAVPGIASGVLFDNLIPRFRTKGAIVGLDDSSASPADSSRKFDFNYVFVDLTTSFTAFIAIYFPSCTGILAGSNRSGDLADAQNSIPRGTIGAQLTTSFVYLSSVVLFGSTFNNVFIRDKFGESTGGQLAVTQIAWPHPHIILIGGLLSTIGAALQSLVGAPRVLQGIAKDDIIPIFKPFAKLSSRGEPENAIKATLLLAWLAVLIGNLDFIAPILTLSLVMCYLFINLACTLHSLLESPGWRPRFKHFHWSISTLGCLLCLFVMIVSSWVYFLLATFLAACIYKYIEFHGAVKEWGDGWSGLALSAARYALLRLEAGKEPHTKNWRPQVLLFCKMKPQSQLDELLLGAQVASRPRSALATVGPHGKIGADSQAPADEHNCDELCVAHPKLLTFAAQLKAGRGLTLVSAIVEAQLEPNSAQIASQAKESLAKAMAAERVKGFGEVLVADSVGAGLAFAIQTAGLGGLKHNTVIVGWPEQWARRCSGRVGGGGGGRGTNSTSQATTTTTTTATTTTTSDDKNKHQDIKTRAELFLECVRAAQVSHNALLVLKKVDGWPESCDKLGGFIDIWWIVNDGGLLMLLPHLLRQHKTWKACQLRVFTIAQPQDDVEQMRSDLQKFLYHLRIEVSQVNIVTLNNAEISSYAYERTLIMEQRAEIMKRLKMNRRQSILLEQDDGRLLRIRKPSTSDLEDAVSLLAIQQTGGNVDCCLPSPARAKAIAAAPVSQAAAEQTTSSTANNDLASGNINININSAQQQQQQQEQRVHGVSAPNEANVRRMHTALTLNEAILSRSKSAKLVIINLPDAPRETSQRDASNYMEFVETITNKLERVLLVQNEGREVITIQS